MSKKYAIDINGPIGIFPCDSGAIGYAMSTLPKGNITVRISSLGGDIVDAMKIYHLFELHGNVTVELYGFVASAATIIATAAKEVRIHQSALYLMHQSSAYFGSYLSWVNQSEIDNLISSLEGDKDMLTKIDTMMAAIYAKKCKKTTSELLEMMKDARWIPANEVVSLGLADDILSGAAEITPSLTSERKAMFAASGYPDPPAIADKKPTSTIATVLKAISGVFPSANNSEDATTNQPNIIMNIPTICALLNLASAEASNGLVSLSTEQLTALEASIVASNSAIAERDATIVASQATIESLAARIQELGNLPAANSNPAPIPIDSSVSTEIENNPYALLVSMRAKRNSFKNK